MPVGACVQATATVSGLAVSLTATASTVGIVNVNRAPWPQPALSAQMRPSNVRAVTGRYPQALGDTADS